MPSRKRKGGRSLSSSSFNLESKLNFSSKSSKIIRAKKVNPGYVKLEPPFPLSGQGGVVAAAEGAAVAEDGADSEGDGQD